jgi:hypothetical protein
MVFDEIDWPYARSETMIRPRFTRPTRSAEDFAFMRLETPTTFFCEVIAQRR